MNLYPIAEYLQLRGVGVMTETIFVQFMPANIETGVLVVEPLQGMLIDHELPGYLKGTIQIITRAGTIPEALDLAQKATSELTMDNSKQVLGYHINFIRPRHQPAAFPASEGNSFEVYVNFDINCTEL